MTVVTKFINLLNVARGSNSEVYAESATKEPIIEYNPNEITQLTAVYLQAYMRAASGDTVYVELYNRTDSVAITGSEISTTSTTVTLVTSSDIKANMDTGSTKYIVRWKADDGAGGAPAGTSTISRVCLITKQSGVNIESIVTDIELAEQDGSIPTSYGIPTNAARFLYEAARWDGVASTSFAVTLVGGGGANSISAMLYDLTAGAAVSGSEVTHNGTSKSHTLQSITLVDGHLYVPIIKSPLATTSLLSAGIRIVQYDPVNKIAATDCYIPVINAVVTSTSPTYAYQSTKIDFDASDFDASTKVFKYEGTLKSSGGNTAYSNLYNNTDAGELAVVTTTSTTFVRIRDSTISMPTDDNNDLISGIKVDTSGTITVPRSFLIAQLDWTPGTAHTKTLSETISVASLLIKTFSRALQESVSLSSVLTTLKTMYEVFSNTLNITSSLIRDITKTFSNTLNTVSSLIRDFATIFSSTINTSSTLVRYIIKNISNILGLGEVFEKIHQRGILLLESINLTSNLTLGSAFFRALTDSINTTDSLIRAVNKVFVDSLIKSSTLTFLGTVSKTLTLIYNILAFALGLRARPTLLHAELDNPILVQPKTDAPRVFETKGDAPTFLSAKQE